MVRRELVLSRNLHVLMNVKFSDLCESGLGFLGRVNEELVGTSGD